MVFFPKHLLLATVRGRRLSLLNLCSDMIQMLFSQEFWKSFPFEAEEGKKESPAWLYCCNASYMGQGGGLQFLSKVFMLPPFTKGLMVAHRSCLPHTAYPCTCSGKQLWQMFSSSIMLMCQRISVEMRANQSHSYFEWILETVQRNVLEVHNTPPLK